MARISGRRGLALAEPLGFVLLIEAYIWVVQPRGSVVANVISLAVLAAIPPVSQRLHGVDPRVLGFRFDNLGRSAREVGLFTLAAIALLLALAGAPGRSLVLPRHWGLAILSYPFWGFLQQYALQTYVHRGLRAAGSSPRLAAGACALIFAWLHWPNPVLVPATLIGAYAWCRLYDRAPNLYTLAISHGWLAVLLVSTAPDAWAHNLRVGPGYWTYPP